MISLGNSVLTDLGVAANQCTDLGVDFTNIQNELASPKSTSLGSAAYVSAQSSISLTQAVISAKLMANEAIIQSFTTSSFSSAKSLKINLAAAAIATQNLANLTTASGYVGRAARSLSNASAIALKTIIVSGGNLFRIAAEQLGDATQWLRIAQLNGINDPMLSGIMALLIPNQDPNAGGGIASQ